MKCFRYRSNRRVISLVLSVLILSSGCSTLRPDQYARYGYKGDPIVKEGRPILLVDWIGNLFGALSKLILWNWKVERHNIQPDTEAALNDYLTAHPEMGNLAVQLNRYAPQDAWHRLFHNSGVKWPYRYTFGILSVLILDTILVNRIFGGDRYDPFTHTVYLQSDLPSIALHELGHAKDFSGRRYRGSYALLRIVPLTDLYQEYKASQIAFDHLRRGKNIKGEIEAYKILYPAYGTYAGSYLPLFGLGSILGAIIGHIWGRSEARALERRAKFAS